MSKITNEVLALQIKERIDDVLSLTGLTLTGLAKLCNINAGTLRSHYNKATPITIETVSKICKPLSIPIHIFLNFDTEIIEITSQGRLQQFHDAFFHKGLKYFIKEPKVYKISKKNKTPLEQNDDIQRADIYAATGNKKHRLIFANLVYRTNYFDTARSIKELTEEIRTEFNTEIESGRVYQLLSKYIGKELERIPIPRTNNDGSSSKRQIFLYQKKP